MGLYLTDCKERKALKPWSIYTYRNRLTSILDLPAPLAALTPRRAAELYEALVRRPTRRGAKRRPDTHRGALVVARGFGVWCVENKRLPGNPFTSVKPQGQLSTGKPQLRLDEARRWMQTALELAETDIGAVMALTALLLGLRRSEVAERVVRDLDDEGRILWIPQSKTEKGRRHVEIPEVLQPHLRALTRGKLPLAPLFGRSGQIVLEWTKKICNKAGVPSVCAHSLRGLHATLATRAGATGHLVADQLGHTNEAMTRRHYIAPGTVEEAEQGRVIDLLTRKRIVP